MLGRYSRIFGDDISGGDIQGGVTGRHLEALFGDDIP